jgi:hypothetical protein
VNALPMTCPTCQQPEISPGGRIIHTTDCSLRAVERIRRGVVRFAEAYTWPSDELSMAAWDAMTQFARARWHGQSECGWFRIAGRDGAYVVVIVGSDLGNLCELADVAKRFGGRVTEREPNAIAAARARRWHHHVDDALRIQAGQPPGSGEHRGHNIIVDTSGHIVARYGGGQG